MHAAQQLALGTGLALLEAQGVHEHRGGARRREAGRGGVRGSRGDAGAAGEDGDVALLLARERGHVELDPRAHREHRGIRAQGDRVRRRGALGQIGDVLEDEVLHPVGHDARTGGLPRGQGLEPERLALRCAHRVVAGQLHSRRGVERVERQRAAGVDDRGAERARIDDGDTLRQHDAGAQVVLVARGDVAGEGDAQRQILARQVGAVLSHGDSRRAGAGQRRVHAEAGDHQQSGAQGRRRGARDPLLDSSAHARPLDPVFRMTRHAALQSKPTAHGGRSCSPESMPEPASRASIRALEHADPAGGPAPSKTAFTTNPMFWKAAKCSGKPQRPAGRVRSRVIYGAGIARSHPSRAGSAPGSTVRMTRFR